MRNPPPHDVRKRKPSQADLLFPQHMAELDVLVRKEIRVCKERRWRFDFAEREPVHGRPKLAFEIDGGSWVAGRHTRGAGFQSDIDKINQAQILGWVVFRFTPQDVLSGKARETVRLWLNKNQ